MADSTPLIALSAIRRLPLLQQLYHRILLSRGVYREVVHEGRGRPGSIELLEAKWAQVWPDEAICEGEPSILGLGLGESETIRLAEKIRADLILMDETAGRREALSRGFRLIGTVGVLQQAKLQRLFPVLKPELDALRSNGFFLSERVYRLALAQVREEHG